MDNAEIAYIEWTEQGAALAIQAKKSEKAVKKTTKKTEKIKKEAKAETVKPIVEVKQKPKLGGMLKQIVTRQKKGQ